MSIVYLKGNREVEVSYDQSVFIAKYLVLYPNDMTMTVNGVSFCANDIDLKKEKQMKFPQQTAFDINVPVVEKKHKQNME